MTIDDAIEEVVADACEEMLLSSRLAMEMAYEKPELERTIVDWLKKFAAKIKAAVSPDARRHTEAVIMREFADELQTMWDRALTRATLRPDGGTPSVAEATPPSEREAGATPSVAEATPPSEREAGATPSVAEATPHPTGWLAHTSEREAWGTPSDVAAHETRSETEEREDVREAGTKASVRETDDGRIVAVVDNDILSHIDTNIWNAENIKLAKKAASDALKKYQNGIVVNGITRNVNRTSRKEYTKSKYSAWLAANIPEYFADKMRAADIADDVIIATTDWYSDGRIKHPRTDNFIDFDHGTTLIQSGENQYTAEVVVGLTENNDAVFYDVVNIKPTEFKIKEQNPLTTATAHNVSGDIREGSATAKVSQPSEIVKQKNAFEKTMPEIKASERDSEGRELSAGQAEYFAKNTDNLNPTEDADIRFSNRDRTEGDTEEERRGREESYAALRKENERLKRQAEYWKGQTKTTKEKTVREKDIERFAQTLLKEYGSDAEKAGVVSKLRELGNYLINADEVSYEELYEKAQEIATDILENVETVIADEMKNERKAIVDYLRGSPINLSPLIKSGEIDMDWIRAHPEIKYRLKGQRVDSAYAELQAMFGLSVFPEDIISDGDKARRIVEVLDAYEPVTGNPFELYMGEAVTDAAQRIIDFTDFPLRHIETTFGSYLLQDLSRL